MKGDKFHIDTLLDVLNNMVNKPRNDAAMRLPISGVYKIKGVDVLAGRVEQGAVRPGEVVFIPTHTVSNPQPARCSLSRCTTSASTRLTPVTTSA